MTDKPSNVIELHDRITVTFSPAVTRLIKAEIERQHRTRAPERVQTALEIAEEHVRDYCETMAMELIEVRR
jgi:ribosomal 50S subunit-recycling heat shock protein